jgi:hypothetical protein
MWDICTGINEFKKHYQCRTNLLKDDYNDLLADSHNILNIQKTCFCQLLNVYGINDVRQTEMHTAETLEPECSCFQVEIVTEKLERYKSPGIYQILT